MKAFALYFNIIAPTSSKELIRIHLFPVEIIFKSERELLFDLIVLQTHRLAVLLWPGSLSHQIRLSNLWNESVTSAGAQKRLVFDDKWPISTPVLLLSRLSCDLCLRAA